MRVNRIYFQGGAGTSSADSRRYVGDTHIAASGWAPHASTRQFPAPPNSPTSEAAASQLCAVPNWLRVFSCTVEEEKEMYYSITAEMILAQPSLDSGLRVVLSRGQK